jgi:hypothetical protein
MTNEKALSVMKQILDAASKGGLFENMDASFLAAKCFNHIASQLQEKDGQVLQDADGIDN